MAKVRPRPLNDEVHVPLGADPTSQGIGFVNYLLHHRRVVFTGQGTSSTQLVHRWRGRPIKISHDETTIRRGVLQSAALDSTACTALERLLAAYPRPDDFWEKTRKCELVFRDRWYIMEEEDLLNPIEVAEDDPMRSADPARVGFLEGNDAGDETHQTDISSDIGDLLAFSSDEGEDMDEDSWGMEEEETTDIILQYPKPDPEVPSEDGGLYLSDTEANGHRSIFDIVDNPVEHSFQIPQPKPNSQIDFPPPLVQTADVKAQGKIPKTGAKDAARGGKSEPRTPINLARRIQAKHSGPFKSPKKQEAIGTGTAKAQGGPSLPSTFRANQIQGPPLNKPAGVQNRMRMGSAARCPLESKGRIGTIPNLADLCRSALGSRSSGRVPISEWGARQQLGVRNSPVAPPNFINKTALISKHQLNAAPRGNFPSATGLLRSCVIDLTDDPDETQPEIVHKNPIRRERRQECPRGQKQPAVPSIRQEAVIDLTLDDEETDPEQLVASELSQGQESFGGGTQVSSPAPSDLVLDDDPLLQFLEREMEREYEGDGNVQVGQDVLAQIEVAEQERAEMETPEFNRNVLLEMMDAGCEGGNWEEYGSELLRSDTEVPEELRTPSQGEQVDYEAACEEAAFQQNEWEAGPSSRKRKKPKKAKKPKKQKKTKGRRTRRLDSDDSDDCDTSNDPDFLPEEEITELVSEAAFAEEVEPQDPAVVDTTPPAKKSRKGNQRRDKAKANSSSKYRGVTKHRITGKFEAHLWDSTAIRTNTGKKGRKRGKQVYLGGYTLEEEAARAYDRAAIAFWGVDAFINFDIADYAEELDYLETAEKEDVIQMLRRESSGFSRGASKYRGVTRHHQHGRWEARIGRVDGDKYLYLGTYDCEEDAAHAYDKAALKFRGRKAITNFDRNIYDPREIESIKYEPLRRGTKRTLQRPDDNARRNRPRH